MSSAKYTYALDVSKMIAEMGGPVEVHALLRDTGLADISLDAVYKWDKRGNIPVDGLAVLLAARFKKDVEYVDLYGYLVKV